MDKTASPMNRYTQWEVLPDGIWGNPKSVSFHALPQEGWLEIDGFDWGQVDMTEK